MVSQSEVRSQKSGARRRNSERGSHLSACPSRCLSVPRSLRPSVSGRRGVILLVVMVLLALMTLMGLTLVLVTAQGRLSALATSRKSVQPEHDVQELASARVQVIAGSTDPNSPLAAHSLLEDLYGLPQFFGRIVPNTTVYPVGETAAGAVLLSGGNNGTLLQFTITAAQSAGAAGLGPQTALQYVLPYNSGAFCGQVITMLTGPAKGESARVVGYYFDPATLIATIQVSTFGGIVPNPGDEFMINGRPYAGTGFGLDLTKFQPGAGQTGPWVAPYTQPGYTSTGPLLTAVESVVNPSNPNAAALGMPYAYLPNHSRIGLTQYLPMAGGTYWDLAGPGGANETYDSPDFQNMMLAMHYYHPTLGQVITPIPSLHRPELVGWYFYQSILYGNPNISMGNWNDGNGGQNMLAMRRKVILRPEPTDNQFVDSNANGVWDAREPFWDVAGNYATTAPNTLPTGALYLDLNGDGAWTPGETDYTGKTFNPVTGCWYITATGGWALDTNGGLVQPFGLDVDNDGDGIPDSIWVDAGMQVHTESDGTLTKNLVAVLCIDLDGKVNLNASGTLAQLDPFRYPYNPYLNTNGVDNDQGTPPNPWAYPAVDRTAVALAPNTIPGPMTAAGSISAYGVGGANPIDYNQRLVPVGQGNGSPDVNPVHLFLRSHGSAAALNYYQVFLQGFDGYPNAPATVPIVDGKYGESTKLTLPANPGFKYPGVDPIGSAQPVPWGVGVSPLTWTQYFLNGPRAGASQWYDPFATWELVNSGYAAYWVNDPVALSRFSDVRPFLLLPGFVAPAPFFFDFLVPATHQPTAHGSPSDLHSRGFLTKDVLGRPYYAGTATLPWYALPGAYQGQMTDYAINLYTGTYPFLVQESVLNEGVDTAYELDLRQNTRALGQNTGNSVNGIPDYASVDSKISPSELEGVLRARELLTGSTADPSNQIQRLNNLETAADYLATLYTGNPTTSAQKTRLAFDVNGQPYDKVRLSATSESWDLPVPNMALTPRQIQDIVQYVDFTVAGSVPGNALGPQTQALNLANISLADLARARIYVENQPGNVNKAGLAPYFVFGGNFNADLAIFGNLKNTRQPVPVFPTLNAAPAPLYPNVPVWPLLAPETIMGMRLDINRLLGNGVDDNGNGVVDEPMEVFWQTALTIGGTTYNVGESLGYPFSQVPIPGSPASSILTPAGTVNPVTQMPNMLGVLDLNNDGFYPVGVPSGLTSVDPQLTALNAAAAYLPADLTGADSRARQLLARHLYVTMMLLLDDRTFGNGTTGLTGNPQMLAQIFNTTTGASMPGTLPQYNLLTPREQAAYIIAQWAINVVDFRDRDSIMTPFEFDLYPFRADDGSNANNVNITWNVDDIVGPSSPDDINPFGVRGLVWGCERPELLLTETLATHDRGTADTARAQNINDPTQTPATGPDTLYLQAGPPQDKDFDQVRRPRGSLIVELFNPTNPSDAPQRDLQFDAVLAANGVGQPFGIGAPGMQADVNGNAGYGVNLAQVAMGTPDPASTGPLWSPVWRLAIAYSPFPTISEAAFYKNTPYPGAGKQLDPRVPVLPYTATPPTYPNLYIHRAVYFTPYQTFFNTAGPGGNATLVNDVLLNRSFFLDPDLLSSYSGALSDNIGALMLPPSQYAVVAPACADINAATAPTYQYRNYLGRNSGSATGNGNFSARALMLGLSQQSGAANTSTTTMFNLSAGTQTPVPPYGALPAPIIGVPIQTTWLDSTQTYIKHNHTNINPAAPYNATAITTGQTLTSTLRMSVSEPEHGYPVYATVGTGSAWDDDTYYQYNVAMMPNAAVAQFPQHPFDSGQPNPQGGGSYLLAGDQPNNYVAPNGTTAESMRTCYTVIYLQRLANPLNHWDALANPYITVDSMPVDLTAYTGEWATAELGQTNYLNATPGPTDAFDTRRRGYVTSSAGVNGTGPSVAVGLPAGGATPATSGEGVANIWTPLPILPNTPLAAGQYGVSTGQGTSAAPFSLATLGYTNTEYGALLGVPSLPMPWITWNNRPFVSQYELMLVPQSSPSTLAQDFSMLGWYVDTGTTAINGKSPEQPAQLTLGPPVPPAVTPTVLSTPNALNEYSPLQPSVMPPAAYGVLPVSQFAHLLNFFNSVQPVGTQTTGSYLPNLYRIFEFLQVPSRYTGTQDMLDPSQFAGNDAVLGTSAVTLNFNTSHNFHTPFNWLSRYREPGKINLNTIFDPVVFKCLMDDYPGSLFTINGVGDPTVAPSGTSLWNYLCLSRQGFILTNGGGMSPPNPISQFTTAGTATYPTYFANPFRPDSSTAFVPPTTWNPAAPVLPPAAPVSTAPLGEPWIYPGTTGGFSFGVNATTLRPANLAAPTLALFDDTAFDTNNLNANYSSSPISGTYTPPLPASFTPFRDSGRDAMFQYQMFTRLGNTTTNRSNVYAVWITLGKFQVQQVGVSLSNPDGYKLVAPYNDAAGNQVKTRGFYIFDRSIPMGFQRGQDLNIEKGMLLERVLQLPQ
jgi:hypothetical protein